MSALPAGQHAVVTGGGSGIGFAVARALVGAGAAVTIVSRDAERLENARASLSAGGGAVSARAADVGDERAVRAAFAAAVAEYGEVTILVNNAGAVETGPFERVSSESFRRIVDVNLTGTFLCTREVVPAMARAGAGRIVNIASSAGLVGYPYVAPYVAAKHGVVGLTRALALELADKGVTVNAVCPGYVDTDMARGSAARVAEKTGRDTDAVLAEFAAQNPQGRLLRPEEVADVVLWVCAPERADVTGRAMTMEEERSQ